MVRPDVAVDIRKGGDSVNRFVIRFVAGFLMSVSGANAQTTTGRLIGTVVDDEGGALPGVNVTIGSRADRLSCWYGSC